MIDARRLRVLREVAEHGTVAAAADALHLTPSAVSQQLAALEREVGQPVVERNGRGVRLTGAAEVLVGHANLVLAQLEAAEADVAAFADGIVGTVRVAGFATGLAEIAAPAAAALRVTHPRLTLVFEEQEAPHCFVQLGRRDADIALSMASRQAPPPDDPRFHIRPLRSDTLDAVLPEQHPLAKLDEVPLGALAGEPFVGPPDGTSCHDVTITGCAAAGFAPGFAHRSLDFHTTMALVAAGLGVALVPRLYVEADLAQGRLAAPWPPASPVAKTFCLVLPSPIELSSEPLQAFARWLLGEAHASARPARSAP